MFDRILSMFHKETNVTKLPEADAQHALGALLVRAAKIDKAYLFEEIEQIDDVLAHRYGLNPVQAAKMRAECEKLEEAMPDTDALSTILHDAISLEEREATVAALWAVVFADGVEAEAEDQLLHQVEAILGVSPDVSKKLHDAAMAARNQG
ncbi:TerB family tellurite resistance protein [Loktanella sp. F6476L]|uniref:tellurite resistance TerB family protein n=1 Tax=Loktanella sp. F6476L TaxID=2926405 RepID=UPI001FF18209|nr:TerB family tellurite resistance protein [Loktanella sp. F6476L]MCK0120510.1 TerB family tellurite resistance protein [Loktanella sp. F6476L]UWQ99299.1 TerB family tellurite resistance protein [Rhodobacteraceae bacterium S2214]